MSNPTAEDLVATVVRLQAELKPIGDAVETAVKSLDEHLDRYRVLTQQVNEAREAARDALLRRFMPDREELVVDVDAIAYRLRGFGR